LPHDGTAERDDQLVTAVSLRKPIPCVFDRLEATGHYGLALYAALTGHGATVQVIHPIQSAGLRNVYIRVTKTDPTDSFLMAHLLRIGRHAETVVPEAPPGRCATCRAGAWSFP
jgi:transposase